MNHTLLLPAKPFYVVADTFLQEIWSSYAASVHVNSQILNEMGISGFPTYKSFHRRSFEKTIF